MRCRELLFARRERVLGHERGNRGLFIEAAVCMLVMAACGSAQHDGTQNSAYPWVPQGYVFQVPGNATPVALRVNPLPTVHEGQLAMVGVGIHALWKSQCIKQIDDQGNMTLTIGEEAGSAVSVTLQKQPDGTVSSVVSVRIVSDTVSIDHDGRISVGLDDPVGMLVIDSLEWESGAAIAMACHLTGMHGGALYTMTAHGRD